ncbi:MAG: hypothetical protein U1E60_19025 [Reyranellaceae bacterium]
MGDALTPAARRRAAHRAAHVMAPTAGPRLLTTALDMRDTARRLATMAEMLVLFVEREIAANPVNKVVDPSLTPLEKVRAMVCQMWDVSGEVGTHADTVAFWGKEIEPLSPRWQIAHGADRRRFVGRGA